jgi:hypothetical protein
MDEPTVPEMIRALAAQMDLVRADVLRMEQAQSLYVTREVYDIRHGQIVERVASLEEANRSRSRLAWSSGILPVVVALVVWAMTAGVAR